MKRLSKRLFSLLLAGVLCFSTVSTDVFAAENAPSQVSEDAEDSESEEPADEAEDEAADETDTAEEETKDDADADGESADDASSEDEEEAKDDAEADSDADTDADKAETDDTNTEKKAETPADETEAEAFDYKTTVSGYEITLHAAEGVFPEGTTVTVKKASAAKETRMENLVEEELEKEESIEETVTFDITFRDKAGKEIEPEGDSVEISVKLASAFLDVLNETESAEVRVYHVDDEDALECVAVDTDVKKTVEFKADEFSSYIIVIVSNNAPDFTAPIVTGIEFSSTTLPVIPYLDADLNDDWDTPCETARVSITEEGSGVDYLSLVYTNTKNAKQEFDIYASYGDWDVERGICEARFNAGEASPGTYELTELTVMDITGNCTSMEGAEIPASLKAQKLTVAAPGRENSFNLSVSKTELSKTSLNVSSRPPEYPDWNPEYPNWDPEYPDPEDYGGWDTPAYEAAVEQYEADQKAWNEAYEKYQADQEAWDAAYQAYRTAYEKYEASHKQTITLTYSTDEAVVLERAELVFRSDKGATRINGWSTWFDEEYNPKPAPSRSGKLVADYMLESNMPNGTWYLDAILVRSENAGVYTYSYLDVAGGLPKKTFTVSGASTGGEDRDMDFQVESLMFDDVPGATVDEATGTQTFELGAASKTITATLKLKKPVIATYIDLSFFSTISSHELTAEYSYEGDWEDLEASDEYKLTIHVPMELAAGTYVPGYIYAYGEGERFQADMGQRTFPAALRQNKVVLNNPLYPAGYRINYQLNGGTNHPDNPAMYDGESDVELKAPTREGCVFAGWYTDSALTKSATKIAKGATGSKTFYAKWVPNTYTIKFAANGGSGTMASLTGVKCGAAKTLPTNGFKKNGFTFTGWNTSEDGEGDDYADQDSVMNLTLVNGATVTLYAQWEEAEYTITYVLNGGENAGDNPLSYRFTDEEITLTPAERTGYDFAGWYSDAKLTKAVTKIASGSYGNKTFYAKWTPYTGTVVFDGNGGSGTMASLTGIKHNVPFTLSANAYKKAGYRFLGWIDEASGIEYSDKQSEIVLDLTEGSCTLTLKAVWAKIDYTITYNNCNSPVRNTNPKTYSVTSDTITLVPASRDGYEFSGWYTDSKLTKKAVSIPAGSTGNKTFYAKWTPYSMTVVFHGNGATSGSMKNFVIKTGVGVTLPANTFKRTGYQFDGWDSDPESIFAERPDKNHIDGPYVYVDEEYDQGTLDLYAIWTPTLYTLTYTLNDGTKATVKTGFTPETENFELMVPSRTGYIFEGWYKDSKFKSAYPSFKKGTIGNLTLYAKWTPITYRITFNKNHEDAVGEMAPLAGIKYDKAVKLTANKFTRPGYTFIGWDKLAASEGAIIANAASVKNLTDENNEEVVLYAQWEKTKYTISYNLSGGVNGEGNPAYYYEDDEPIELEAASKTGYTFGGWYSDAKFTKPVTTIDCSKKAKVTLYAKFTPNAYSIVLDANGGTGTAMKKLNAKYGANVKLTKNTYKRAGYTFNGWDTAAEGDGTAFKDASTVKNLAEASGAEVTLYAQWKTIAYKITYNLNGGTNSESNPASYTVENETIELADATRTGYIFGGWYSNKTFTSAAVTQIDPAKKAAVTLYAKWTPITYTIHFDDGNSIMEKVGEDLYPVTGTMEDVTVRYDEKYVLPSPTYVCEGRDIYTWVQLETDLDTFLEHQEDYEMYTYNVGTSVKNLADTQDAVVTLYPSDWELIRYPIVYHTNGGTLAYPDLNYYTKDGSGRTHLMSATKPGYSLEGWYADSKCTESKKYIDDYASTTSGGTIHAYAKWTPRTYRIMFVGTRGSGSMDDKDKKIVSDEKMVANFKYGQSVKLPTCKYTGAGLKFKGWRVYGPASFPSLIKDGATVKNLCGDSYAGDNVMVTLVAEWEEVNTTISYVLNGGTNSPSNVTSQWMGGTPGPRYVALYAPTRSGYTFGGWYTDSKLKTPTEFSDHLDISKGGTIKLYAKWTVNKYNITFDANRPGPYVSVSGVMSAVTGAAYDKTLKLPKSTFKANGYTFAGWNTARNGSGTAYKDGASVKNLTTANEGIVTLYAQWKANKYAITYITNGGILREAPTSFNTGTGRIDLPEAGDITRPDSGGTFGGWYLDYRCTYPITEIDTDYPGNVTVYAKWL